MREIEPTTITQGERIEWTKDFCDYPASLYSLEYRFRGTGPGFNVAATAAGDAFVAEVTTANSAACSLGRYDWQAWLTETADSTNKFVVASGRVKVLRGFTSAATGNIDLRSDAKIALDAVNATLLNAASSDQLEYEISTPAGSRKIRRMSRVELLAMQKHFAGIVSRENAAERAKSTGQFGRQVVINVRENG
jgi:hypothetical protein